MCAMRGGVNWIFIFHVSCHLVRSFLHCRLKSYNTVSYRITMGGIMEWLYRLGSDPKHEKFLDDLYRENKEVLDRLYEKVRPIEDKVERDVSYSGLVDEIQGDRKKGMEIIIEVLNEYKSDALAESRAKAELDRVTGRLNSAPVVIERIFSHLNMPFPDVMVVGNKTITRTDNGLRIEEVFVIDSDPRKL